MKHKEADLIKQYGWRKDHLKFVRSEIQQFDGHPLWFREESKKPKHLQTIWWTDVGLLYLQEYHKAHSEMQEVIDSVTEKKIMTKNDFNKTVNDTKWVGRIVNNSYKNVNTVMIEHDTGFRVIVHCKNNKVLPRNSFVEVDTKSNRHSVRKPAFKSYEKAKQS